MNKLILLAAAIATYAMPPGYAEQEQSISGSALPVEIDSEGWRLVVHATEIELPFSPNLLAAIREGSESGEFGLLPGKGHATDLFDHNPELHMELIDRILENLP